MTRRTREPSPPPPCPWGAALCPWPFCPWGAAPCREVRWGGRSFRVCFRPIWFLWNLNARAGFEPAIFDFSSRPAASTTAPVPLAPVAETGFSHRLTAYKIVGHIFGLSYRKISGSNEVKNIFCKISNISVPCPHAQLKGRTVTFQFHARMLSSKVAQSLKSYGDFSDLGVGIAISHRHVGFFGWGKYIYQRPRRGRHGNRSPALYPSKKTFQSMNRINGHEALN